MSVHAKLNYDSLLEGANIFSKTVAEYLKYYVYIYCDPDTDEVFYVGKGKGNRAFFHLNDSSENEKTQRIEEIRSRGKEPRIEILIHGLEEESISRKIETSVIDLLGKENLTNKVGGWGNIAYGRMTAQQVIAFYERDEVMIAEPSMLIRINQMFRYGMSDIELYDATRGVWKVGEQRDKVKYAFTVYHGIIQEVYHVAAWYPAGTTFSTRGSLDHRVGRWEFVGQVASDLRNKYIGKSVDHYFSYGSQYPIKYVNI